MVHSEGRQTCLLETMVLFQLAIAPLPGVINMQEKLRVELSWP